MSGWWRVLFILSCFLLGYGLEHLGIRGSDPGDAVAEGRPVDDHGADIDQGPAPGGGMAVREAIHRGG